MTFDGKAFGAEIVGVVKGYLAKELAPLAARLDSLEKRVEAIPAPIDLSADLAALKASVQSINIPELPELPELPDFSAIIDEAVKTAVAGIPVPKDGHSVTVDDVAPLISSEVEKRIGEMPKAKNGDPGADGVGMAGALIDRKGHLIVTMTNGETKDLGPVVGRDGDPGKDGAPGFALEDFDATLMDDGRTVLLSFTGKDMDYKVELGFPAMIYRGVYRDGSYEKGDTVTWGGSLWHCDAEKTDEKPGEGSKAWTLCAKKGRDGRDGEVKEAKPHQPVRVGVPAKGE